MRKKNANTPAICKTYEPVSPAGSYLVATKQKKKGKNNANPNPICEEHEFDYS